MVDVDVESNAVAFLLVDGRVFSLDVRSRVVREGGNGDTHPLGFGKEEIKSEEGSADFWTREILQFCPSDSSSLCTFDRSFFCPDTRDGDVKLTICRAFLFLIEQHQIHQVSLLGHLQLGH